MNAQDILRLRFEELAPGRHFNKDEKLDGLIGERSAEIHRANLNYAPAHKAIICRFGRFPHRNAVPGRGSTPEEPGFFFQPGWSF
ncbi:MAG: DUF924 family protein [Gammaproteobacteria bacterium]|nr:DUF924 family protein [Gammaproteobacteria bacterium]